MTRRQRLLKPDSVIIEPTSGNTGIGLALWRGQGLSTSYNAGDDEPERRNLLKAYGAELV